ncbi:MAG TPA: hypothetical protein VEQ10_11860 [Vicinamibacteria bacterium]|nr:hypothetical protein [Vicinamibacteria bacterium]
MQALVLAAFLVSPGGARGAPQVGAATVETQSGLPLRGEEAEIFLRTAKVVRHRPLGTGVSGSEQLTLTDGAAIHKAVWKTINEFHPGLTHFEGGGTILDYEDSYRFEIAAYELDKLLGFELVPPTVERALGHKTGSLQMWVEGTITEWDRKQRGLVPPDGEQWNRQIHAVRLLQQLTFDWDAQNIRNVLVDTSFRVYAIDFSRSFAVYDKVDQEKLLERFPRARLAAMKALDEATLAAKLGRFIGRPQIRTLLKRRDQILAIAARRVAEKGEDAVLY